MKDKYTKFARKAIDRVMHSIDPDDWDQRPANICKGCGNHINACSCKTKSRAKFAAQTHEPSIDFYA
jgi:hypothetical protein